MLRPKRKMDYEGLQVKASRELRNGFVRIPEGYILIVESSGPKGFSLVGLKCDCCEVRPFISNVRESCFQIIRNNYNEEMIAWNSKRHYKKGLYGRVLIDPKIPKPQLINLKKRSDGNSNIAFES